MTDYSREFESPLAEKKDVRNYEIEAIKQICKGMHKDAIKTLLEILDKREPL